jgi:hypothetical protein
MHWLVTGISGCGKSRIMKQVIIPNWRRQGVKVAVLDPLQAPDWNADFQEHDPDRFMDRVEQSRRIVVVIDEFGRFTRDYKAFARLEWCATIARNRSILSYFLAQRVMQVHPNVRDQCSNALLFRQTARDLEEIGMLLNEPRCSEAAGFEKGLCLTVKANENPVKIRVFHPN